MDPDEAPPPYAPVDPLLSVNAHSNAISPINPHQPPMQLRGGEAPIPYSETAYSDVSSIFSAGRSSVSTVAPVNFVSAIGFFEERPPPAFQEDGNILQHHLTIYPKTQAKDFPRRPRCWNARADKIAQQDWDTFLNFLFPPHLAPAATSGLLSPRLRAEIQRDRKDRPQETDDERRLRIAAVISEWNQGFFWPRGAQISWIYVSDLESAPPSPLCPRCYPAATSASQDRRAARSRSVETLVPPQTGVSSQSDYSETPTEANANTASALQAPGPPCISSAIKSFAPWGLFPGASGWSRATSTDQCRWSSPAWPLGPQSGPSQHWGGGPLAWVAELGMNANRFAEHVSMQAQEYGRHMEEQAMSHGRWLEDQARSRSRQIEEMGQSFAGLGRRAPGPDAWGPPAPCNPPWGQRGQRGQWCEDRGRGRNRHRRRGRSPSTDSSSSASSFSSIDTISTTSDLEVTDLSSVRAQLSSLHGHHHRDSYAAALRLRHHLQALQQLRRHARFNGSRGRGSCWGGHAGNSRMSRGRGWPFGVQHHGLGRGGRAPWEAPIELQPSPSPADRRALKEEKKAVEKAFRDVVRRARDEAKETRRSRRHEARDRRRRGRRQPPEGEIPQPAPLNLASTTTYGTARIASPPDPSVSSATQAFSSLTLSDAEGRSRT
ncbi:conserved hypothetical protein [Paecilomyces variotii No. 5]|uniref:Uncharacterized protein n=1 Tax=Byssochlamys spectabilis (strain No. 5 / NBRC 109023) TaxID=1356009 RepID=V5FX51_BYSSN|nr:conserved hypothetical protein [Paecilomyces variotii No. 5]